MVKHGNRWPWIIWRWSISSYKNRPSLASVRSLEWQTMLIKGVFTYFAKKNAFSIFKVQKLGVFMKQLPRICLENAPPQHSHIVDHIVWEIHQLDASQQLSRHFSSFIQLSADLLGSVPNLNYRCFMVCSWFFQKIILRYASCHLMGDPIRVLQYLTPG